jgi:hypothetical protein
MRFEDFLVGQVGSSLNHWPPGGDLQFGGQRALQAFHVPLLLDGLFRHVGAEDVGDDALAHGGDGFGDVVGFQQFVALVVDHLALVVGNVVIFEQLLADVEVAGLDLALRRLQRTGDERMLDGLAFRHLQLVHDGAQALAGEDAQQRSSSDR